MEASPPRSASVGLVEALRILAAPDELSRGGAVFVVGQHCGVLSTQVLDGAVSCPMAAHGQR